MDGNITSEELDRHATDLAAKLEGKTTKEVILKELNRYVYEYNIAIDVAESGILKKYSAPRTTVSSSIGAPVVKKVADFKGDEQNCTLKVKILSCRNHTVKNKDGVEKTILSGIAGDETGTIGFTIWRSDADIQPEKVYSFSGVYGKKFRDQPQVNIGTKGKFTLLDEDIIVTASAPSMSGGEAVVKKISELTGDEGNVTVTAQIVSVTKRTTTIKDEARTIISGTAGDDTGTIPFTIWSDKGDYEKGAAYTFSNAYCRKFRDEPQLNVGERGSVTPAPDAHFNVPVTAEMTDISKIGEQTRIVNVTGRVIEASTRKVFVKDEERTVWGGTIADSTGKIQFSAWNDPGMSEGKVYAVTGASVRSWKGIPQLNINDSSSISESNVEINVQNTSNSRTVEEVSRTGGGIDVSITGIIVDVKTGSGLIKRCPTCRRAIKDGQCSQHGLVSDPTDDLRLKTTIDDGTGAISVIIGRGDTEMITGITLDEAKSAAQDAGDSSAISNRMASKVLLKKVTVTGNVMTDDKYGPQMSARSLTEVTTDVKAEAEHLYSDMEAML